MVTSEVFKALGDETRLRILSLLSKNELCVCQIEETLKIPQPSVSKHLNRLRDTGLLSCRKTAQWCFYSISEAFRCQHRQLFGYLLEQWNCTKPYTDDMQRLRRVQQSGLCSKRSEKTQRRP